MSYLEMDNQFRIQANDVRYSYRTGLLYASCFGYSEDTKSLIKNINRRGNVHLDGARIELSANSFETYSSKISGTDYFHTIIIRKDEYYKDESDEEYIFCTICSEYKNGKIYDSVFADKLYQKLNKLSSVPLLREWMDFIIQNMRSSGNIFDDVDRNIGRSMSKEKLYIDALTIRERWLIDLISYGLRNGEINIENCRNVSPIMESITGLDDYIENFNEIFTEKIQCSFRPKFIPQQDSYNQTLVNLNDYSSYMSDFQYYPAQLSVSQSVSNNLDVQKSTFVCAEMGSGIVL